MASLLFALLLIVLQTGTPAAHGLVHLFSARAAHAATAGSTAPSWQVAAADERPCALCAADELPALPGTPIRETPPRSLRPELPPLTARTRSTAPLEVFCRPPPAA